MHQKSLSHWKNLIIPGMCMLVLSWANPFPLSLALGFLAGMFFGEGWWLWITSKEEDS